MENTLAGVAGKKFILSYSCGKDSTLCLHKMLEAGAEPMALLVMFNPEAGRSYFHGVDPALLREYGEALELPPACPAPPHGAPRHTGVRRRIPADRLRRSSR